VSQATLDKVENVGTKMAGRFANCEIGDFLLQDLIAQHSSLEIYRATQKMLRRLVQFKMISLRSISEQDEDLIQEFQNDVRKVAALEHMHLQPIYGYGVFDENHIYVAGRLIAGSLHDLLKVGVLSLEQSFTFAQQTASALTYIHSRGFIHKSLSPYNLYIGEDQNIYANDLELAPIVQAARSLQELKVHLEEPFYASVEQLQFGDLDVRTDIYSLGAILYHMVTGKPPFSDEGNSFERVLARKADNQLIQPRILNPTIASQFEAVILRSLRANPDERFSDVQSMSHELEQLPIALSSTRPSSIERFRGFFGQIRKKL
jgi:serine/threonine protein kinase